MKIPVDPEHTPELMAVIERQQAERRPTCPFIFHGRNCGAPRFDRDGKRRPCLGDFQKVWDHACAAMGMASRIPHDLRRSGVSTILMPESTRTPSCGGRGIAQSRCSSATTLWTYMTSAAPGEGE